MKPTHPLTVLRLSAIEQVLADQPMHVHDVAAAVHLSKRWAVEYLQYLQYLHDQRRVRIARWEYRKAGNEYPVPVYALGAGRDAAKPAATTSQQKAALARRRRNADPEARDLFLARIRAHRRLQRPPVDPLVAALFGMGAR